MKPKHIHRPETSERLFQTCNPFFLSVVKFLLLSANVFVDSYLIKVKNINKIDPKFMASEKSEASGGKTPRSLTNGSNGSM